MELEELVTLLTKKLIRQMEDKGRSILVLANNEPSLETFFLEHLGGTRNFFFLDDDCKDKEFNEYILPTLTLSQMADLAMGKAEDGIGKKVLDLVLKGKTVSVVEYEYKKYLKTAPEALLRHYESLERQLNNFGIKGFEKEDTSALRLRKKVLTQQDIAVAVQASKFLVQVACDTCITPLAREFARDHEIQIQRI